MFPAPDTETPPLRPEVTRCPPKPVPVKAAFEQSAAPAREQKRQPNMSSAAYEQRVEKNLHRLERAEQQERLRRKRRRPAARLAG